MHKRTLLQTAAVLALAGASGLSLAQDNVFKIGLIVPMTGQQATTGRQIEAAAKLWMAQNGDTVAGKKVQLIVKDDASVPANTRRLAQELVVNDKVNVLAGMGITPSALAVAPIATQSKTPLVVMAAATSSITEASPFITRSSFTLPQASVALADWAPKNGIKSVVTLVSDYGPGIDAEKFFSEPSSRSASNRRARWMSPRSSPCHSPAEMMIGKRSRDQRCADVCGSAKMS